ncbi:predicted protein [Enterococcus gallinarum EG2]|nr:predicted protein [Enterococcus gallinarum EG2]
MFLTVQTFLFLLFKWYNRSITSMRHCVWEISGFSILNENENSSEIFRKVYLLGGKVGISLISLFY